MRRGSLIFALLLSCALSAFSQSSASGASTESGSSSDFPGQDCAITTASLPTATLNVVYSATIQTNFCIPQTIFSVTGSIPTGLAFDTTTGIFSGTPTAPGTYSFTVTAVDSTGHSAIFPTALSISAVGGGGGGTSILLPPDPALSAFDTSINGTPTNNVTICVGTPMNPAALPGGGCFGTQFPATTTGVQSAVNAAQCGQIINVANVAGLGHITLPNNKKCPNTAWIWLTGDLSDPAFPPEGVRPDPSLIGIPQWVQPWMPYSLANGTPNTAGRHMPQFITVATSNTAPITMSIPSSGANTPSIGHWRIQRIQCARDQSGDALGVGCINFDYQPAASGQDCALSGSGNSALPINPVACAADQPDHIVISQIASLSDPQRQTTRAIALGGGTFIVIKDSWIQDLQTSFAGGLGDAQSFAGGFGHGYTGSGDWLFQNNFSSSSSEGSLFCGAFSEPQSPITGKSGTPDSVIWNQGFFYKPILWDTQRGQSLNESLTNEGITYPPQADQEIVWNPVAFQVQQGAAMQLNNTWLNDSAGGWNRFNDAGTPPNVTGTATVDGVDYKTINSANGIVTKTVVSALGSAPWQVVNTLQWAYTACSAPGVPIAACTTATNVGPHTLVFDGLATEGRYSLNGTMVLGNNRHLITTITPTVTAGAPVNQIALTPSAPDLQIQPSYSDTSGNNRNFAYVFTAALNFSSTSLTWKVCDANGANCVTNGTRAIGQICSVTAIPCTTPGTNDSRVVFVSGTSTGARTITVTSAAGTTASQPINVTRTSPIWAYDMKAMTVKNMWEAKCLTRGVFHHNLLENTHGSNGNGGGQDTAALEQPANNANQVTDGSGANVGYGPMQDADILFDQNHLLHTGGGLIVAGLNVAKGIHRVTFSNNLIEDFNCSRYGHGFKFQNPKFCNFLQFSGTTGNGYGPNNTPGILPWTAPGTPVANDVTFDHNTSVGGNTTIFGVYTWLSIANQNINTSVTPNTGSYQLGPFAVTNSITVTPGTTPFFNNNGEANDCGTNQTANKTEATQFQGAAYSPPTPCFTTYSLAHNLLLGNTASGLFSTPTIWNNVDPTDASVFRNYGADPGNGGDYRLVPGSPYAAGGARQATDGTDLGAPVASILLNDQAVRWGSASPMVISTDDTLTATSGTAFSKTLAVSGGTGPYTWSLPTGIHPAGAEDILDYAAMPEPDRRNFCMNGPSNPKCFKLDGGLLWWEKSFTGNPWDGEVVGPDYLKQWFTENTWTNASSFKMYVNAVSLWKRYHMPGDDDVVYTPGPNKYSTTDNCGIDNLPLIDNLGVRGELTGPFTDVPWQTNCIAAGGTLATCNVPDGTPYLLAQKWIKCTSNNITSCTDEEDYWLAKGFGQIQWCPKTRSGSTFVTGTCTTTQQKIAHAAVTPNFACGVPNPQVTNGLPAGVTRSSAPPMTLVDSTGVINGTPNAPGTYQFTVQVKDSLGRYATKTFTLTVH